MIVSFVSENKECPVCLKDERIAKLELGERYLLAFIAWSVDRIRVIMYNGFDKEERERSKKCIRC